MVTHGMFRDSIILVATVVFPEALAPPTPGKQLYVNITINICLTTHNIMRLKVGHANLKKYWLQVKKNLILYFRIQFSMKM